MKFLVIVINSLASFALCSSNAVGTEHTQRTSYQDWAEFTSFAYRGTDSLYDQKQSEADQYYNPVIAGFYPDPSICRVGQDFYLVNSSFSYYPGVPIFHSTDLVNWTQLGHVLDRPSQLNLDGSKVSDGIYAPAISHHDGIFYMITTNVHGIGNFYVTATDPSGPWSDPIKLNFGGIDPSFFFDDDGKVYIVHNGGPPLDKPLYSGHRAIWMWEYDLDTKKVSNGRIIINGGVDLSEEPSWIEGPHLFKHGDYYYLSCAEGGTGPNHRQVVFRTKSLDAPFLPYEKNPILTQRGQDRNRSNPVTSVGHADLVETGNGEWWAVFLGVRPYEGNHYNIGRETFLLPVTWKDGWPVILEENQLLPRVVKRPNLPKQNSQEIPTTGSFIWLDSFDEAELAMQWIFLRGPKEADWWSLSQKPDSLLIAPRSQSLVSTREKDVPAPGTPSFIARRLQHQCFNASTTLVLNKTQTAYESGLAALQNNDSYFFLGIRTTKNNNFELFLETNTKDSKKYEILADKHAFSGAKQVELRIDGVGKDYTFYYRIKPESEWTVVKQGVDGRILSTQSAGGFVGTVIGMYARLCNVTK